MTKHVRRCLAVALLAIFPNFVVPVRAEGGLIMDRLRRDGARVTSLGGAAGMDAYLVRTSSVGIVPDLSVIYLAPGGAKAVLGWAFETCGDGMRNVTAMQMAETLHGVRRGECPQAAPGFLEYLRGLGASVEPSADLGGMPGYVTRSAKGDRALFYLAPGGNQAITGTVIDASGDVLSPPWEIGSRPGASGPRGRPRSVPPHPESAASVAPPLNGARK